MAESLLPQKQTEAKAPQAAAQIVAKIAVEPDVNFINDAQLASIDKIAKEHSVFLAPPISTGGAKFQFGSTELADNSSFICDLELLNTGASEIDITSGGGAGIQEGRIYTFAVRQSTTSARTLTWDTGRFKFPADTPPLMTATLGKVDVYRYVGVSNDLFGGSSSNFHLLFVGVEQDIAPLTG